MADTSLGNQPWFSYLSSITSIVIEDGVTYIGASAFYNFYCVTSITIGNSVTRVGESAFNTLDACTSITLGNSITTIDRWAFSGCFNLESITLPASVTTIGEDAFYRMKSGSTIYTYNPSLLVADTHYTASRTTVVDLSTRTVTFKDWDGTVLKTQVVSNGGTATAPTDPGRVGYTFTGWDKSFSNVTSDLVVTAQYTLNSYTVTFKDWDGTVLKTESVSHGSSATAPVSPTRSGYVFTGWDTGFGSVTVDTVVTAQYVLAVPTGVSLLSDSHPVYRVGDTLSLGTLSLSVSMNDGSTKTILGSNCSVRLVRKG